MRIAEARTDKYGAVAPIRIIKNSTKSLRMYAIQPRPMSGISTLQSGCILPNSLFGFVYCDSLAFSKLINDF